ncbi:MAG: hypothetical protein HY211_06180 [Candidatus Omnitrophica bacterium]|nr:hypothetical protein [Candidatus Omnitrophota bacterium]
MRSVETNSSFPLSAVKPLEELASYREFCLSQTLKALQQGRRKRQISPVTHQPLEPCGETAGLEYGRCSQTGSFFLMTLPPASAWTQLLEEVNRFRHSPEAFHFTHARSRSDRVYLPKLEWIQETLRFQRLVSPAVLEVAPSPSDLMPLLKESGLFSKGFTSSEQDASKSSLDQEPVEVALLLEALDRSDDPEALLEAVRKRMVTGGLLFVTALVVSGFDMAVLGMNNLYWVPPDRANGFSLKGLTQFLTRFGFNLLEVSTPGVLDLEIVQAHRQRDPSIPLSVFERQLLESDEQTRMGFQSFLQQQGLSSFARLVARKA